MKTTTTTKFAVPKSAGNLTTGITSPHSGRTTHRLKTAAMLTTRTSIFITSQGPQTIPTEVNNRTTTTITLTSGSPTRISVIHPSRTDPSAPEPYRVMPTQLLGTTIPRQIGKGPAQIDDQRSLTTSSSHPSVSAIYPSRSDPLATRSHGLVTTQRMGPFLTRDVGKSSA